jgi:CheY-like chemotaxis protein
MTTARALVIDDNPQNLKVLSQMLSKQGVACDECMNPVKLSDSLPELEPVDVVFLDLEMPGLDGYVVKDMLREHFGDIPIIAYTVHVSEMNVVRRLGFNGFLSKPLSNERFPTQLARILRGESVWDRV